MSAALPDSASPHRPGFDAFTQAARPGVVVPVYRELLADLETPVSAYLKLARPGDHSFLLESVEGGEQVAHYSFVGCDVAAVARFGAGEGVVEHADGTREPLASADPLAFVERELRPVAGDVRGLPAFVGGVVGYLGYECAGLYERVPVADGAGLDVPDAVLLCVDAMLVFDHVRHRVLALGLARIDDDTDHAAAYAAAAARVDALVERLAQPVPEPPVDATTPGDGGVRAPERCNTDQAAFLDSVRAVQRHIEDGDVIQAVVSQRWSRATSATPLQVYRALRMVNPSPYMHFLQLGDIAVVGASPELLTQVRGDVVHTHPIAGTRPRGETPELDDALERELLADPKERAEHVMLVDLGRNDVGRVARPGTVEVTDLMRVERYSHVMHITSRVRGVLRDGLLPTDALRACFPAGTVTGAPKLRAMQIVAGLEPDRRGPYAGAVGAIGHGGALDMAITIRTMVLQGGVAHVQAGAGIVADSVPEREYEETRSKARALLRAIDLAETFGAHTTPAAHVRSSTLAAKEA